MSRKALVPIELPAAPTQPLEAATKQYADDGDATTLFSANSYTNNRVLKAGDAMTGPLDITVGAGVVPLDLFTPAASANYITFVCGAGRLGYVGVFPADGTQFRLYADTGELFLRTATNMIFHSGGTETARMLTAGTFLVGKDTSSADTVGLIMTGLGATHRYFMATMDSTAAGVIVNKIGSGKAVASDFVAFRYDNAARGQITATSGGVAYNTTSDHRLKNDLGPITGARERLLLLRPIEFEWKEAPGTVEEGFFAHEVQDVVPYAVTGEKDAVAGPPPLVEVVDEETGETRESPDPDAPPEGEIIPQQLDYSKLVTLLTAALQEVSAQVDEMREIVAGLSQRLTTLEAP